MSCVVGIICEYNPFHKGHKYQIEQIKFNFPDSIIVSIMSGNIVQRGEFAMLDKYDRARIAIECGVNAVFEIPFPYCGSTAEIFANAGVEIAEKLGCDYLCFGVEDFDAIDVENVADTIDSDAFEKEIKYFLEDKRNSYIVSKQKALKKLNCKLPISANDILAVEYARAIKLKGYGLKLFPIKRIGAGYNDRHKCEIMSATAIRESFYDKGFFESVPESANEIYDDILAREKYLSLETSERVLHSFAILNGEDISLAFDSNEEIASLIVKEAKNYDSELFLDALGTKNYTKARLKRALLYTLFNIENVDFSPKFTILLGTDSVGRTIAKKTVLGFTIITKHSDASKMSEKEKSILETVYSVDQIHGLMLKKASVPSDAYKRRPIIKKDSTD